MKKDDPRLTALVLGELPDEEAQELWKRVASSEELQAEVDEMTDFSGLLTATLGGKELSLGEERREQIRQAGRVKDEKVLVMRHQRRSRWQTAAVISGAAAVVACGFYLLGRMPTSGGSGGSGGYSEVAAQSGGLYEGGEVDARAAAGVAVNGAGIASSGVARVHGQRAGLDFATQVQPVMEIEKSLVENRLPQEISLRDLVNYPMYEVGSDVELDGMKVRYEVGVAPWDEQKALVAVWVESEKKRAATVELLFEKKHVRSFRTLGKFEVGEMEVREIEGGHCQLFEFEPVGEGVRFFSLEVMFENDFGEVKEAYLPGDGKLKLWAQCSEEFQLAAILAGFAQAVNEKRSVQPWVEKARALKVGEARGRYALDLVKQAGEMP